MNLNFAKLSARELSGETYLTIPYNIHIGFNIVKPFRKVKVLSNAELPLY